MTEIQQLISRQLLVC